VSNKSWAAVFDVDGTMIDNLQAHRMAWVEFGRAHGMEVTDEYYRTKIHARTNDLIIADMFGKNFNRRLLQEFAAEKEQIYRRLYRPALSEIPGLTPLLHQLNEHGVPCAIASNAPAENIQMVLDKLRIGSLFAVVLTESDAKKGKPDPELFLLAAERLRMPPRNCLVFEDSPNGFLAAEQAGMPYVIISQGAEPKSLISARLARAVYRDFTQLNFKVLSSLL